MQPEPTTSHFPLYVGCHHATVKAPFFFPLVCTLTGLLLSARGRGPLRLPPSSCAPRGEDCPLRLDGHGLQLAVGDLGAGVPAAAAADHGVHLIDKTRREEEGGWSHRGRKRERERERERQQQEARGRVERGQNEWKGTSPFFPSCLPFRQGGGRGGLSWFLLH